MWIRQLSGNKKIKYIPSGSILTCCLMVLCFHLMTSAQTQFSKWEWNVTATMHRPSPIKQTVGNDKIQIRPSAGWEFGFAREIATKGNYKFDFGYNRGSTPVYLFIKLAIRDYPVLRIDYASSFYYVQHPYNLFYFRIRKKLSDNTTIGLELANRFYTSSSAGTGLAGFNALTGSRLLIYRARTYSAGTPTFSPHLKLSFTGTIWKRFPSFLYEASLCYAPISVISGSYVLFPYYPAYISAGTFRVQQSYLGLAIKYRRVKKED